MKYHRQISIREMLLLALFAGLGLAGLSMGGFLGSAVIGISIVVAIAMAIVAFVARDQPQAIAIGFLIPVVVYAATVLSIGTTELDPYEGKLPTTKLLKRPFQFVVRQSYVNVLTGEPLPNYDPTANANLGSGGFGGFAGVAGLKEEPDRAEFMSLAHVLIAMASGYVGARFALWVHVQQRPNARGGGQPLDVA